MGISRNRDDRQCGIIQVDFNTELSRDFNQFLENMT